jgi:hypothetical protein
LRRLLRMDRAGGSIRLKDINFFIYMTISWMIITSTSSIPRWRYGTRTYIKINLKKLSITDFRNWYELKYFECNEWIKILPSGIYVTSAMLHAQKRGCVAKVT